MNKPKIGFVTLQNIETDQVASTRIRVTWALKYMPNSFVSEKYEELKKCDAVVFQSRHECPDLVLAEKLKKDDVKLIWDFTDPHWLKEYDPNAIHPIFYQVAKLADMVTLPTEELARTFAEAFPENSIAIIKDRLEFEFFIKVKKHIEHNDLKIMWCGSYGNLCSIDLARPDLERLGTEFNIKFICVYDILNRHHIKIKPFKNIELDEREWSNQVTTDALLESDVSINPKYNNWKSYKSDNKTIMSWICGVPCVENDFYNEIKKYLLNTQLRNENGLAMRKYVLENCDVKQTAEDWHTIANSLIDLSKHKVKKKKPKIVVYTAINGNFDGLREDQFIDDTADYYVFTEDNLKSNIWEIKPFYAPFVDPVRNAKLFKVLPWQFFPEYKYSIWIDGSMAIKVSPQELINKFLNGYDMAVYKHSARQCIYDEVIVDINYRKEEPVFLREIQIEKYKREGIPDNVGLWECSALIRRHTPQVTNLCNEWWAEISAFTSSDQCCFARTIYLQKFPINPIVPGNINNNPYFSRVPHEETWKYTLKANILDKVTPLLYKIDLSKQVFHLDKLYEQEINIVCKASKIGFVILDDITRGIFNNFSNRPRILAKYIIQSQVSSSLVYLSNCDVVIYHNRFEPHDIEYVIANKKKKKFILDLSEAWWEQRFIFTTDYKKQLCKQMINTVNAVVVPNSSMEMLIKKRFKDIKVVLIEDNTFMVGKFVRLINEL